MILLNHLLTLLPLQRLALDGGKYRWCWVGLQRFLGGVGLVVKISVLSACSYPSFAEETKAELPPELKPYVLPTFSGVEPAISNEITPLVEAPVINSDAIFQRILSCYPQKSKWAIDVELKGSLASGSIISESGSNLGRNYVQIVASMPLYSAKEMDRAIKNEHDLRQETAKTVSSFVKAVADRNHALRKIALYTSLEKRSSVRVQSGVVAATEQIGFLEKVAKAHEENIKAESDIMTSRIALSAMCSGRNYKAMNEYLAKIGAAP